MQLEHLKTKFIGRNVFLFDEIDSTQMELWRKSDSLKNGTIFIANVQTAGIGTHGRKWHTSECGNIAFSFLVNLECDVNALDGITVSTAHIVRDILSDLYNIKSDINPPNDIYCNGKKLCGILIETKVSSNKVTKILVGIGMNTIQENFDIEISDIATSIKKEFGIVVNNEMIISEICNRFEKELLKRIGEKI